MRALPTVLVAVLVIAVPLFGVVAAPPASGAPGGAEALVESVTVSPSQPAPGQLVTVQTTVSNAGSATESMTITDVYVREAGTTTEYARVTDVGTVPAGGDVTVPLTFPFEEGGVKDLRVHVVLRAGNDYLRLQYPASVVVREGGPQVAVSGLRDTVAGAETNATVTVSNGETEALRSLHLRVAGTDVDVADGTRVAPTLAAGEERSFVVPVTPQSAGEGRVTATLSYTAPTGERRSITEDVALDPDPLREDVDVSATVAGDGSPSPPVAVEVANFGNAPLREGSVRLVADGETVARSSLAPVPAEARRTVRLNVTGVDAADLRVVTDYRTGDRAGSAETTLTYSANPGRIELTGVDVEREGGRLHLSGSASNVGLGEVNSVVVAVVPTENVTPARPYEEYFVGTVPESDFVSFDLYAEAGPGVTEIPVEVRYIADGQRRTTTATVAVGDLSAPSDDGGTDSSGPPTTLIVGVFLGLLVLLALAGGGVYYFVYR
jgi:hypothetical protein